MKKQFSTFMVTCMLILISMHAQALIVEDPLSIANANMNQAINIAKFTAQVDLLTNQLTQLQQAYKSMTGTRGFGDLLKTESFKDNLPEHWESTYDQVRHNGYSGLSPEAKKIYDKNKIFDKCQSITLADEKQVCEAQSVKAAQDQAFALDAIQKSKERLICIQQLLDEVKNTKDPKGIAELQARIGVEQNAISNDQAKLAMFKMAAEAEDKMQQERAKQLIAKDSAKRGGIHVTPLTFDTQKN